MCAYNIIAWGKDSQVHPAIAGTLGGPPWVAFCASPAAMGVATGGRQAAAHVWWGCGIFLRDRSFPPGIM